MLTRMFSSTLPIISLVDGHTQVRFDWIGNRDPNQPGIQQDHSTPQERPPSAFHNLFPGSYLNKAEGNLGSFWLLVRGLDPLSCES